MTIFAGLFCRHGGARVGDSTCDALRRTLSRDIRDAVSEFRDARVFLAKVDIGAYGEPAFLVRPGGSVSFSPESRCSRLEIPAWHEAAARTSRCCTTAGTDQTAARLPEHAACSAPCTTTRTRVASRSSRTSSVSGLCTTGSAKIM